MFEYNNKQYTLQELQASATKHGYDDFDEFLQMWKDKGLKEIGKEKPDVVGEVKKIPGLDIMLPGVDRYVAPYLFDFILGVEDIAEGTIDVLNVGAEKALGVSREQQLENKRRREFERPKTGFITLITVDGADLIADCNPSSPI